MNATATAPEPQPARGDVKTARFLAKQFPGSPIGLLLEQLAREVERLQSDADRLARLAAAQESDPLAFGEVVWRVTGGMTGEAPAPIRDAIDAVLPAATTAAPNESTTAHAGSGT